MMNPVGPVGLPPRSHGQPQEDWLDDDDDDSHRGDGDDDDPIRIYRQHMLLEEERRRKEHEKSNLQQLPEDKFLATFQQHVFQWDSDPNKGKKEQPKEDNYEFITKDNPNVDELWNKTKKPVTSPPIAAAAVAASADSETSTKLSREAQKLQQFAQKKKKKTSSSSTNSDATQTTSESTTSTASTSTSSRSRTPMETVAPEAPPVAEEQEQAPPPTSNYRRSQSRNNPLDTWQILEENEMEEIEELPQPERQQRRPQVGAFDASDDRGQVQRQKVSFSHFSRSQEFGTRSQEFGASSYGGSDDGMNIEEGNHDGEEDVDVERSGHLSQDGGELTAEVTTIQPTSKQDKSHHTNNNNNVLNPKDQIRYRIRGWIIIVSALLLIAIISVILVVVFLQPSEGGDGEDNAMAPIPGDFDGTGLVSRERGIELLQASFDLDTLQLIKENRLSPQGLAYQWVIDDPLFDQIEPWRHLQRFALATIYFSTRGPLWRQPHNWLSYEVSECEWTHALPTTTTVSSGSDSQDSDDEEPEITNSTEWEQDSRNSSSNSSQRLLQTQPQHPQPHQQGPDHNCDWHGAFARLHLNAIENFGGNLPAQTEYLKALEEIHITNMPARLSLPDFLPDQLSTLPKLKSLDFSGSNLENSFIPTKIGTFSTLQSIQITNSNLAGTLPTQIGSLRDLVDLDLSQNQIGWALPSEWAQLSNLLYLYLQNNRLIGGLPAQWGDISYLRQLDVSHNQLSGTIPGEWGDMAFLQVLRLHHNDGLMGEMPDELCGGFSIADIFVDCRKVPCCFRAGCICV